MRPPPKLSPVELEVLQDVARGLGNQEIANRQHRSPETIHSHLKNIYYKLRARNRAHAVAIAYHLGIFRGVNQIEVAARPLAPARERLPIRSAANEKGNHAGRR